ncbi:MAG: gspE [Ilumatobacteraceae bacterium]|nr:gspE [Ilumatobacteraceae bacterium]
MNTEQATAAICARLAELPLDALVAEPTSRSGEPSAALLAHARSFARQLLPLGSDRDVEASARSAIAHAQGLGPLQRYLADPTVDEIMINNGGDVWIERDGAIALAGRLADDVTPRLLERIISPLGRRLDRLSPIVDARLADGSRVCAVIAPIAVDGPCMTLRRFGVRRRTIDEFADPAIAAVLTELVDTRCNVLISGSTSSGKTSLLNVLASLVGPTERIVTLEDTAELRLGATHVLRLETRPATVDGTPAVTMTDLVRTALRLRPDRIVVGEVRGAEVVDMLGALNTGHSGSLSTCHANGPSDALRRLEALVAQHSPAWPLDAVRDAIATSIDVVVHVERDGAGRRRISDVLELAEPGTGGTHRNLVARGSVTAPRRRGRR